MCSWASHWAVVGGDAKAWWARMRARGVGKGRDWAAGAAVTAVAPASPRAETTVSAEPANRLAMRLCMSLPMEDLPRPTVRSRHVGFSLTTLVEIVAIWQGNPRT